MSRAIRAQLDTWEVRAGVCSLACGADLLFAEALLDRGAELHAILPVRVEDFMAESVAITGDPSWTARFETVRAQASEFEVYGGAHLAGSGTPFHVSLLLIDGHTQLRTRSSGLRPRSLAVWDGRPGDAFGGTASFVGHSVLQGRETVCIDPKSGEVFTPGVEAVRAAGQHSWSRLSQTAETLEHRLASILFADAKGFSGLTEPQLPGFIGEFLGAVRRAIAKPPLPRVINTWGDGVFAVTDEPEQAAQLGLALIEETAKIDHARIGATSPMTLRVGLHAGPVFVGLDPVTGRYNAYGVDVSLAARIEPVVPPGEVWASRAFAALAAATGARGLAFESVGAHELAKGAGGRELYRVSRSGGDTAP